MTLKRIGTVVVVASMLVAQSAIVGAQELDSSLKTPVLAAPVFVPPPYVRPPSAQPAMMMTVGGALAASRSSKKRPSRSLMPITRK